MSKVSTNGVLNDIEVCAGDTIPRRDGVTIPPNGASSKTSTTKEQNMIEIKLEGKGYRKEIMAEKAKEAEGTR